MRQSTLRRLRNASVINGAGFLLASLVTVLWYFLLIKQYHSEAAGRFLLGISAAGLINLLDLGMSLGLVRVLSSGDRNAHPYSPRRYFIVATWATGASELILGAIGVWIWQLLSGQLPSPTACVSVTIFAVSTQVVLLCASALKGVCNFKAANLISTGSIITVYGTGAVAMILGADVWALLPLMAVTLSVCAAVAVVNTLAQLKPHKEANTATVVVPATIVYANLLRTSIPYFPQFFAGIFFMHAQRFFIAKYAGVETVSITSFAYSLATRIHAVISAFSEAIFPMAQQLRENGLKAVSFCLRMGAIAACFYVIAALVLIAAVAALVPDMLAIQVIFCIGVMFAAAAVPAFHLLNGSGASAQVSGCSLLSPLIFACLVIATHAVAAGAAWLSPAAYAATMAAMLPHVALLVRHHARRFDIHQAVNPKENEEPRDLS